MFASGMHNLGPRKLKKPQKYDSFAVTRKMKPKRRSNKKRKDVPSISNPTENFNNIEITVATNTTQTAAIDDISKIVKQNEAMRELLKQIVVTEINKRITESLKKEPLENLGRRLLFHNVSDLQMEFLFGITKKTRRKIYIFDIDVQTLQAKGIVTSMNKSHSEECCTKPNCLHVYERKLVDSVHAKFHSGKNTLKLNFTYLHLTWTGRQRFANG